MRAVSAKRRRATAARRVIRERVFARDGGCVLQPISGPYAPPGPCQGPLTPHHLLKASQGGPYTEENLVTLCSLHNTWVEDAPAEARTLGLVIARGVTAADAADLRAINRIAPHWRPDPDDGEAA